jgi:rhamnosyltransferase
MTLPDRGASESVCGVIITYNIGPELLRCVDSVLPQVEELLIVDNGSEDRTVALLRGFENEKLHIIYNKENLGIAAALNQGAKYALNRHCKWLLTLDQDCEADSRMVSTLLNRYHQITSERQNVAIFTARLVEEAIIGMPVSHRIQQYPLTVMTAGNLVNLDSFRKIGEYREDYFIDYVDCEYCLRLHRRGFVIELVDDACLFHNLGNIKRVRKFGRSFYTTNHSYLRRYYITRNRMRVWWDYFWSFPIFCLTDIFNCCKDIVKIILAEDEKAKKILYSIRGSWDFVRGRTGSLR